MATPDLSTFSSYQPPENNNLVETHIRLLGDKTTICQVVELLAQLRFAVKNNINTEINVKIGKHVVNAPFIMDVNGQEIKDFVIQREFELN